MKSITMLLRNFLFIIILIVLAACVVRQPVVPAQYIQPQINKIDKAEARKLYRGALEDYLRQPLWTATTLRASTYGNHRTFPNLVKHFTADEFVGAQEQDSGRSLLFLYRDKGFISDEWGIIINQFSENSKVKFAYMPDRNEYAIRITDAEFTFGAEIEKKPEVQNGTWSFKYRTANSYGTPAIPLRRFGGYSHNNSLDPICNMVYQELNLTGCNDVILIFGSENAMNEFATILISAFPFLSVE